MLRTVITKTPRLQQFICTLESEDIAHFKPVFNSLTEAHGAALQELGVMITGGISSGTMGDFELMGSPASLSHTQRLHLVRQHSRHPHQTLPSSKISLHLDRALKILPRNIVKKAKWHHLTTLTLRGYITSMNDDENHFPTEAYNGLPIFLLRHPNLTALKAPGAPRYLAQGRHPT
ncbi:hypothetical protein M422DRAFT_274688 [Sphaerobolus stellatus SS14]|uniref:Uncharacterized protein n=1 Tax=Sphaerobolus stellatus (strain SS14) TaxID=990650 RepID=A0A0C9UH62_SPHS4|nr:hypothetical protein M422DRAFT_274688 [Sphaerobolus stellatus SS14]